MKNIKIISATNSSIVGKVISYNEETNVGSIGKESFNLFFGSYQPNKHLGDFKTVDHTINTATEIQLSKVGRKVARYGATVRGFEIL